MLFRLASPVQRKGTRNQQLIRRIPSDIAERAVGTVLHIPVGERRKRVTITPSMAAGSIRVSLGTAEPAEVRKRQGIALEYLDQVFKALRVDAPASLSQRQATALAGRLYRAWANGEERERSISYTIDEDGNSVPDEGDLPGERELVFAAVDAFLDKVEGKGDLETVLGPIVDRLLLEVGVGQVDKPSRALLLDAFWRALKDAMEARERNAAGDYRPDPKAERFPEWSAPTPVPAQLPAPPPVLPQGPKLSLAGLVEEWWRESKAAGFKPRTYESYRNTFKKLVAFLGHDDARRVTPADIVAFKDHRLSTPHPKTGRPASARTVKDADLAGLKSVFNWAVANQKLPSNPAQGISIKLGKQQKLRERGFAEDEVKAILSACQKLQRGQQKPETFAAKRWVPWVLAYTGARVGEIAQLRKQDVLETDGHWSIRITPEAGTVKSNAARIVPLHPHLEDLGFLEFVRTAPYGYLFISSAERKRRLRRPSVDVATGARRGTKRRLQPPEPVDPASLVLGRLTGLKNHLREFVRQYVPDPNVQPNHAWRHLFITRCRAAGVDQELRRMITGHTGAGVDERVYGDPAGLYREVCKLPRFEVR